MSGGMPSIKFIKVNLAAFHSLFMKFFPTSSLSLEKRTSNPCGAINKVPKRTASVPNSLNNVIGSGELPNDLLNFLPLASLKIDVKYTFLKGSSPKNS